MKIEIVTTPNESLKESGFGSHNACISVLGAIQRMGHSIRLNVCSNIDHLDEVVKRKPNVILLAVKYIPINSKYNIWLSDYFTQNGINYSGSSREVLDFDSNKVLAKMHLANNGINTANYFMAIPGQYKTESELPITFPLFLKPLDAANGNGIDDQSFVNNFADYESKIMSLYESFNQPILVEEYLDGREFTVAIIKAFDGRLIVSAVEVIPPTSTNGLKILGAQTKKEDTEILLEIDDDELKNRVTKLAVDTFNSLGVRDFGRIDIKSNKSGECFFMEANLVPGMTHGSSYFPLACGIAHSISYDKVIELLLSGSIARADSAPPSYIRNGSIDKFVVPTANSLAKPV